MLGIARPTLLTLIGRAPPVVRCMHARSRVLSRARRQAKSWTFRAPSVLASSSNTSSFQSPHTCCYPAYPDILDPLDRPRSCECGSRVSTTRFLLIRITVFTRCDAPRRIRTSLT
ncbi:hypothetical protein BJ912DRAFT_983774 [Pholiota molesta]|nr:hypothetical protein BJ912DRAFT_983774 [Pholiota molesta]